MLKGLKINRAYVICKLASIIKDCDRLTKYKSNQEVYLMIYQAYQLKNKKKLLGLKEKNLKIAKSISKFTEVNVDKTQLSKQKKQHIRKNQRNLQEENLFLRPKKLCIRNNQSNPQEEILFLRPKKLCIRKNQSNLQEEILFLRPKKLCNRKKQNNLQGNILSLKQRKENQSNLQEEILFNFKTKDTVYQKESKKSARKDPVFRI